MTSESWQESNNAYLAASLKWLHLRLQRLIPEEPRGAVNAAPAPPTPVSPREPAPWLLSRWLSGDAPPPKQGQLLLEAKPTPLDLQIEQAAAERAAVAQTDPEPALILLAQRLGLSDFERDTLLLCAAMELDPAVPSLCAGAQGYASRTYPTFGLALLALDEPSWDALSAQRPLRYARLLEINQPGALPLTSSPLRADERIVNFVKGLNVVDDRLSSLLSPVSGDGLLLAASQERVVETILERLRQAAAESVLPVVQLVGPDAGSKLAVAHHACAALNRQLYRIGAETLPSQAADLETLARLWQRESLLLPVALYVEAEPVESGTTEAAGAPLKFLSRDLGVVFLSVRETPLRLSGASFSADVDKPTAAEQRQAWVTALGEAAAASASGDTADLLAGQFDVNLGDIHTVSAAARGAPAESGALTERLWSRCRELTRPRLDLLAQRLVAKATWDDLVLPDEATNLLRQIAGHVRERHKVYDQWGFAQRMNRGMGISALFSGESGTGKTMAAEVIANDLRLNLYRIDLSAVVSKFIGETEKNLRKLFDAAEQGGAILFFDEADALFGKRSEVKDSHDRYANIEINYLLQRMEAFSGVAILATNMKSALDPAFMRRLRFIVNFPFPGVKERKLMWEKALPPQTPRADLDYDRLARLTISGGNIHSIVLHAAFLAAQDGQTVTMPLLLAAARTELRKLERPFNEAELR